MNNSTDAHKNSGLVNRLGGPMTVAAFGIVLAVLLYLGLDSRKEAAFRTRAIAEIGLLQAQQHECEASAKDISHKKGEIGYEVPHVHECYDREQALLVYALEQVRLQHEQQTTDIQGIKDDAREQQRVLVTIGREVSNPPSPPPVEPAPPPVVNITTLAPGEELPPPVPGEIQCVGKVRVGVLPDVGLACIIPPGQEKKGE